mmetsp:Transcript_54512/g.176376  ORF Transcript_54512/g.176376 Transcript_54512/m.176376 type:complete len:121 (-) Transcript_54512:735-1097(-)
MKRLSRSAKNIFVHEDEVGMVSKTRLMLRVIVRISFRGSLGGVCSGARSKATLGPEWQCSGIRNWKDSPDAAACPRGVLGVGTSGPPLGVMGGVDALDPGGVPVTGVAATENASEGSCIG